MKKLLAIFMAAIMLLSFTSCNESDGDNGSETSISLEESRKYLEEIINGDVTNLRKMAPSSVWNLREELIEDWDDVLDAINIAHERRQEQLREDYGENVRVKLSVQEQIEMDEEAIERLKNELEETYRIDPADVEECYNVYYLMSYENSEQEVEDGLTTTFLVKIGKSWYHLNYLYWKGHVRFFPAINDDWQLRIDSDELP